MKFIADVMLGRLARWMRLLGFDTLYAPHMSDKRLLKIAREQERIILTKDTRLVKIRGVSEYLLITSNNAFEQLREVIRTLNLRDFKLLSRCAICNGLLSGILDKIEIKESVPEFVFLNFHNFLRCRDCGKVYWEGTHPEKFRLKLTEVLQSDTPQA